MSLLILICFVNLSCCWHPNWYAKYRKDYVTGYNAAGAVIKIAPNFTSYWDLFRASNIDTKSSNPPAQYLNLLNAKGMILRMSLNETYNYMTHEESIEDIYWLPSENIIALTSQKHLMFKNRTNDWNRKQLVGEEGTFILPINGPKDTLIFYCNEHFGFIGGNIDNGQSLHQKINCKDIFYGRQNPSSKPSFWTLSHRIFSFQDAYASSVIFALAETQTETNQSVIYRTYNATYIIYTMQESSSSEVHSLGYTEVTNLRIGTLAKNQKPICKLILGSDSSLKDLLIVGFCNGKLMSMDLERILQPENFNWREWEVERETFDPLPIRDLAFNFIQTTSPEDSHQKGEPVVIISKEFGLAYMYNLATRQAHSLRTWSGASNAHLTGNMIFVPARPDVNYTDPNYAVSSNLEIGLGHGRVWQLLNVDFLQVTPSEAQSHIFTRRVFNNHKSNPLLPYEFYGYYQKKIGWNWAATARSIIRFYWPQTILPTLCQLNNLFSPGGIDCCQRYRTKDETKAKSLTSSFLNTKPSCILEKAKATNALLLALNLYEIQTFVGPVPSFFKIQSEITNNNLIIIKMIDPNDATFHHFITIFGFQKASNPKRFDDDKIIVWDASEESRYKGVTNVLYHNLYFYAYSKKRSLKAEKAIYIRF